MHDKRLFGLAAGIALIGGLSASPACADDAAEIARAMDLPVPVVTTVLKNIDAYFAEMDGPANRFAIGTVKNIAIKAIKERYASLDDSRPGKASEVVGEEKNASFKIEVRTIRHDTAENGECVDSRITASASEGVPVVKDGAFAFDMAHPKLSSYSWVMSFCRAPVKGGAEFSDWQLAPTAQ